MITKALGNLIWTVNVTDDVDTTFSNIRYSVLIEEICRIIS